MTSHDVQTIRATNIQREKIVNVISRCGNLGLVLFAYCIVVIGMAHCFNFVNEIIFGLMLVTFSCTIASVFIAIFGIFKSDDSVQSLSSFECKQMLDLIDHCEDGEAFQTMVLSQGREFIRNDLSQLSIWKYTKKNRIAC